MDHDLRVENSENCIILLKSHISCRKLHIRHARHSSLLQEIVNSYKQVKQEIILAHGLLDEQACKQVKQVKQEELDEEMMEY